MNTMTATPVSNVKVGVVIKVYYNKEANTLQVWLSNQIKRHFIGVIDAMVDKITGGISLRTKFCVKPEGEFLGEDTVKIPVYGLWTPEDKRNAQEQFNRNRTPYHQKTSPTSVGQNAKIVKANS